MTQGDKALSLVAQLSNAVTRRKPALAGQYVPGRGLVYDHDPCLDINRLTSGIGHSPETPIGRQFRKLCFGHMSKAAWVTAVDYRLEG